MAFHNNHFNHFIDQQHQPPPPSQQQQEHHFHESTPPNWLLRSDNNFLNLQTAASAAATSSDSPSSAAANQWLSRSTSFLQRGGGANNNNVGSGDVIDDFTTGGEESMIGEGKEAERWQNARHKSEILSHPLYERLLSAHVACLRIATPVDQLPRIDAQLAQSQNVVAKYSTMDAAAQGLISGDEKELDHFMVT